MADTMELGIYTFGDLTADPQSGRKTTAGDRMRQMLDMARLADETGLEIIGVGEHHGLGFVNSATATTIAAMAAHALAGRGPAAGVRIGGQVAEGIDPQFHRVRHPPLR